MEIRQFNKYAVDLGINPTERRGKKAKIQTNYLKTVLEELTLPLLIKGVIIRLLVEII